MYDRCPERQTGILALDNRGEAEGVSNGNHITRTYPGGSKGRVNRAGDAIRAKAVGDEDGKVLETWRAAHRGVLNTFQAILRGRTRGQSITVAQRHKRRSTIIDKLDRFPGMALSRMDDVAGCRLIFRNVRELLAFRDNFHKARFNHKRRNDKEKYDYLKNPKPDGYRGIHDVYEYHVKSDVGQALTGLYVEIQYRTVVQHAWATAVELIGVVTESQPKFKRGDNRYERAMIFASEILARSFEKLPGPNPALPDRELVEAFLQLDDELKLLDTLRSLNAADKQLMENTNAILIMRPDAPLEVMTYRDAPEALRSLFELEKAHPEYDIVLVRAHTSADVREAFRNYFSDAREFIRYVEEGLEKLGKVKNLRSFVGRRVAAAKRK